MELLLPALIVFMLAFTALSIGVIFGRKGISTSCSSNQGKLSDIECHCGQDSSPVDRIVINAVCADGDVDKCEEILAEFEKQTRSPYSPSD